MPPKKSTNTRAMSAQHKAALAEGREQSRSVRRYLEALEANKPKRGRKRTAESIQRRLDRIEDELQTSDALRSLNLRQERIDLQAEIEAMGEKVDVAELEAEFVSSARGYSDRKGISYDVWREAGVPASVLKRAGISRSGR